MEDFFGETAREGGGECMMNAVHSGKCEHFFSHTDWKCNFNKDVFCIVFVCFL